MTISLQTCRPFHCAHEITRGKLQAVIHAPCHANWSHRAQNVIEPAVFRRRISFIPLAAAREEAEPGTLPTDQYYGTQGSPPDPWRSLRDNWPADTLSSPPKVLSETLVYDGFLRLKKEELSWAGGQVQPYLTLESKPRAVIVLAFTDANELVLCREYRHPTRAANGDGIVTSLPGGIVDAGESPLQAGARELLEEAGYAAERWKVLGSVFPAPGIFSQAVIVAEAEGARPETQRKGAHDPTELLHCRPVPLGILLDAMMCTVDPGNAHAAQQPEILDSLLCAALWLCVMRGRLRPMMSAGK